MTQRGFNSEERGVDSSTIGVFRSAKVVKGGKNFAFEALVAAGDRQGNIGIGYSFGGTPNFAGQRFAGRLAGDPRGELTLHEVVLAQGEAAQTNTKRWEDYTQTAVDPSDDCTIWYVGDYLRRDAPGYSTRIGGFRMPGCGTTVGP